MTQLWVFCSVEKYFYQLKLKAKNLNILLLVHTTISLPLFSGLLASLRAATVLAPDDIPTYTVEVFRS